MKKFKNLDKAEEKGEVLICLILFPTLLSKAYIIKELNNRLELGTWDKLLISFHIWLSIRYFNFKQSASSPLSKGLNHLQCILSFQGCSWELKLNSVVNFNKINEKKKVNVLPEMHMTFSHTMNIMWKKIPVLSEYSSLNLQKANKNGSYSSGWIRKQ